MPCKQRLAGGWRMRGLLRPRHPTLTRPSRSAAFISSSSARLHKEGSRRDNDYSWCLGCLAEAVSAPLLAAPPPARRPSGTKHCSWNRHSRLAWASSRRSRRCCRAGKSAAHAWVGGAAMAFHRQEVMSSRPQPPLMSPCSSAGQPLNALPPAPSCRSQVLWSSIRSEVAARVALLLCAGGRMVWTGGAGGEQTGTTGGGQQRAILMAQGPAEDAATVAETLCSTPASCAAHQIRARRSSRQLHKSRAAARTGDLRGAESEQGCGGTRRRRRRRINHDDGEALNGALHAALAPCVQDAASGAPIDRRNPPVFFSRSISASR